MFHLGRPRPYKHIVDLAAKDCQGKRSSLLGGLINSSQKKFHNICSRPWPDLFLFATSGGSGCDHTTREITFHTKAQRERERKRVIEVCQFLVFKANQIV